MAPMCPFCGDEMVESGGWFSQCGWVWDKKMNGVRSSLGIPFGYVVVFMDECIV